MKDPKIYLEVINPSVSADRRACMEHEFFRAGVTPEFHDAVYYKDYSDERLAAECKPNGPWGPISRGQQAATISHARAWERFLLSEKSHCAIFEDDVFVSGELSAWLSDLRWWPKAAGIVRLEKWVDDRQLVLLDREKVSHLGREVRRMRTRYMGAAGYMLSRDAAKRLLDAKPYDLVIDHLLFNLNASTVARQLDIYQITPGLVRQGNEPANSSKMPLREKESSLTAIGIEIRRGLIELSYPFGTYARWVTGKAKLHSVEFRDMSIMQR